MTGPSRAPEDATILAPSFGLRFSGINATMEALLPVMRSKIPIACCGKNLSGRMPVTTLLKWLRSPSRKHWRIWHARRNNDMLVGLLLRYLLRQRIILLWTSAAQRRHKWLTRFCYHHMDAVIATTGIAAEYLDCPAIVSPHGVDPSVYTPATNRSQMRTQLRLQDRLTLGVFGRIRPQKGTGDLVEALCHVLGDFPDWQVIFVGETTEAFHSYQEEQKAKLASHGFTDRVYFMGFLQDFSDLPKWYQAVDIVGCVSRHEGFGVTCLEGMASGLPVLATRAGAWPDIIEEGQTGWLAEAGNPSDLERGLRIAFSTPRSELERMGQQALATIHGRFTIQHESERIAAIYRQLLEAYGEQWQTFENVQSETPEPVSREPHEVQWESPQTCSATESPVQDAIRSLASFAK